MPFDFSGSVAMVTGASKGIGAAFVRELARRGVGGLVLVARSEKELNALAEEIRAGYPLGNAFPAEKPLVVLPADLSERDAPTRLKAETDRLGITVDLLINNAGYGTHGFFHEAPFAKEQGMVDVNISALIALTREYLPEMVARNRGGILNVGSTAAFQAAPYMTTYAATKAFVQSFTEGIWAEMKEIDSAVRVLCLCPGGTSTHFGDGLDRGRFENMPHETPEQVAVVGLDALDGDAPYVVSGALNNAMAFLFRLTPRQASARIAGRFLRPLQPGEEPLPADLLRNAAIAVGVGAAVLTAGILTTRALRRRQG